MSNVLLTNDVKEDKTAGIKARTDVLRMLKEEGYETIYFPRFKSIKTIREFWRTLSRTVKKGDHIVIEYPVWLKRRLYLVKAFARLHRIKFYGIIHDITSIRFQIDPQRDIVSLRSFDGIISHNSMMTKWLRQSGYKGKIIDLQLFDYLLAEDTAYYNSFSEAPYKLLYAGNLSFAKAAYIYSADFERFCNFSLHIYGHYLEEDKFKGGGVLYKGSFNPDTPAFDCVYQFGLIWEGTSVETCEGEYGNYIRYNNPHKVSLYISLGLPVIVWKEAAIAAFVLEHKIGFAIGSLKELNTILADFSQEEYRVYAENVLKISPKVRKGYFIKTAMQKLVNP